MSRKRSQSRRNQHALEREMFGPEPRAARPRPPRVRGPSEIDPRLLGRIGDCPFCGDYCELGYPGDVWTCTACGGVYVYGSPIPTNLPEGDPRVKIEDNVLAVLSALEPRRNGQHFRIVEILDRKLYSDTNKVLEALGGKWSKKDKAHVFPFDARPRIDATILAGEVRTAADLGFFATPDDVAERLVTFADVKPGHYCLEPSAGTGKLVAAMLHAGVRGLDIVAIELDEDRVEAMKRYLAADLQAIITGDFLTTRFDPVFDRIVMNPPFGLKVRAETGADWMDHVLRAWAMLKPGGVLASICPNGLLYRRDTAHVGFRKWAKEHEGETVELPEDANVKTCMLRLVK